MTAFAGTSRILIIAWTHFIYGADAANAISNDLGIAAFVVMFSGVAIGAQMLHMIPGMKPAEALFRLNGVVRAWLFTIVLVCLVLCLTSLLKPTLFTAGYAICIWVLSQSIYWIFRGFWLANNKYHNVLFVDASACVVLIAIGIMHMVDYRSSASTAISCYYICILITILICYWNLNKGLPREFEAIRVNRFWYSGLSNLVSGGLAALVPTLCYQTGAQALAAFVSLSTSLYALVAMSVRVRINESLPFIANQIRLEAPVHKILSNDTAAIRVIVALGFIVSFF